MTTIYKQSKKTHQEKEMTDQYIITGGELDIFCPNDGNEMKKEICSRLYQSGQDKIVYSRTIKKPTFSSVKHQELAFKEVESDGGYGWVALKFKLEIGDVVQVIRQKDGKQ